MCWVLLPVIFKVAERLETTNQVKQAHESIAVQSRLSRSIWVLAICLSVVSFYKAEHGLVLLYVSLTVGGQGPDTLTVDSQYYLHRFKQPRYISDSMHLSL
jgi:hypothetical protein